MNDPHPSPDALLDLALGLHGDPQPLRAHAADCAPCAARLDALVAEQAALRAAWPQPEAGESAALAERIVAALPAASPADRPTHAAPLAAAPAGRRRAPRPATWVRPLVPLAAAAALLIAVGVALWPRPASTALPDLRAQVRRSEALALFPEEVR